MIHYDFPIIRTIDDVLPHIENRPEFGINRNPDYTVIQYNVNMFDTFAWDPQQPLTSAMRRECRGLIFESDGMQRIIRRPFHKFKNVNEDQYHQTQNIDLFSQQHWIREKMDGSMIAPFVIPGSDTVIYGTKRGNTDIGRNAARYANNELSQEFHNWVKCIIRDGYTPIFEWCSPDNRIVVEYSKPQLILLAVRHRTTGEYITDLDSLNFPGTIVSEMPGMMDNATQLVNQCKTLEHAEGYVLTFNDGHMVKFKGEWYLGIHGFKEMVNSTRAIMKLFYDNKLDDGIGVLPENDREIIQQKVKKFIDVEHHVAAVLEHHMDKIHSVYGDDRKRIALEYMPNLDKTTVSLLFQALGSGVPVNECLNARIKQCTERTNKVFDEFVDWMKYV